MPNNNSTRNTSRHMHDGHRERLKKKFYEFGPESLSEHEILEMLLFYCIPRKNTNEIAHMLINEFGSLDAVIRAPINLLIKVPGIKLGSAIFISLINHISNVMFKAKTKHRASRSFKSMSALDKFCGEHIYSPDEERIEVVLLDSSMKLIDYKIASGSSSSAQLSYDKITKFALEASAANVIIAHNHPSGSPKPSAADVELTSRVEAALSIFNINLVEHVIVCEDNSYPTMRFRSKSMKPTVNGNALSDDFYNKFYNS